MLPWGEEGVGGRVGSNGTQARGKCARMPAINVMLDVRGRP